MRYFQSNIGKAKLHVQNSHVWQGGSQGNIIGSLRFDYGYESEYEYEILSLRIIYCKLDVMFYNTCLANSS